MKRITDEGVSAADTRQADVLADLKEEREALAEREHHLAAVEEVLEARQAQVAEARRKLEFAEQARHRTTAELERRFAEIASREEELAAVADDLDARRVEIEERLRVAAQREQAALLGAQRVVEDLCETERRQFELDKRLADIAERERVLDARARELAKQERATAAAEAHVAGQQTTLGEETAMVEARRQEVHEQERRLAESERATERHARRVVEQEAEVARRGREAAALVEALADRETALEARQRELEERAVALSILDERDAAVRERELRMSDVERREQELELSKQDAEVRDRELAVRDRDLAERTEQLVGVIRGQGKAAVELDRKAADVARREELVEAREAELAALWETAETSALDRAEAGIAPRLALVAEREHDLARREALAGRVVPKPEAEAAPLPSRAAPVSRAEVHATAQRGFAPPERNLSILEALVAEHRVQFADRADEWDAYLHHLRGYTDASGVLPETFEGLVRDAFGPLLDLVDEKGQPVGSSTRNVEPPPARASAQMRPSINSTSSRQM